MAQALDVCLSYIVGSPVPTLLHPWVWPWSLPTELVFWLDLEAVPSPWTFLAIWTVSWGWLSLQACSVRWEKMSWSQDSHQGTDCTHTGADPEQWSRRNRAGAVLARLLLNTYFYFKYKHHCLLASSRACEIQHLKDDADQNKGLVSSKISSISSPGP